MAENVEYVKFVFRIARSSFQEVDSSFQKVVTKYNKKRGVCNVRTETAISIIRKSG